MVSKHIIFFTLLCVLLPYLSVSQNIEYIENRGQWNENIFYKAEIPDGAMFFESDAIVFNFRHPDDYPRHKHDECSTNNQNPTPNLENGFEYQDECDQLNSRIRFHAFKLRFVNCNRNAILTADKMLTGINNYFIGNDQRKWASNVKKYAQLSYKNIFDDIDMITTSRNNTVVYDFIVRPYANAATIVMQYDGVSQMYIQNEQLHIQTSVNEIIDLAPKAYQIINGDSIPVACNFVLNENRVSFAFPKGYNPAHTLIIDPELIFSRYSGSSADNFGYTATYDTEGHLFSGGTVFSIGYPTTLGAYDATFLELGYNDTDMGITKWALDGSAPIYSTYLGGDFDDELPHSLVVNANGELYILGTSGSPDFPTTDNAFDRTYNNPTNAFNPIYPRGLGVFFMYGTDIVVTKLNKEGTTLLGSTFVGGSLDDGFNSNGTQMYLINGRWYYYGDTLNSLKYNYGDEVRGEIIVDEFDNCYVATSTRSTNFPVTANAFQKNHAGGKKDGCVFKMNSDLSEITWGSYLGGSNDDATFSVALSSENDLYVTGGTTSADFPVTSGAYSVTYNGGTVDAYITHIKNDGSQILHSTFFGSSQFDMAYFINLDRFNNAYILGQTQAPDSTLVYNVKFSIPNTGQFIAKLNSSLSKRVYSTVFGKTTTKLGTPVQVDISPTAFLVDVCRRVYVSGWGGSTNSVSVGAHGGDTYNLPVKNTDWSNFYQPTTDGSDFYVMVLDENIDSVHYASYIGGGISHEHVDGGTSRFDRRGNIYQAVCGGCGGNSDFPIVVPAGIDGTNKSWNCNIAIFKMKLNLPSTIAEFELPESGCAPFAAQFNNTSTGVDYHWDFGDGTVSTEKSPKHIFAKGGTYMVQLIASDPDGCNLSDTIVKQFKVSENQATTLPNIEICANSSVQIGFEPTNPPPSSYQWIPAKGLSDATISNPILETNRSTQFKLLQTLNSCVDTFHLKVTIKPPVNNKYKAAYWVFGQNAVVDFNGTIPVATATSAMATIEGSSSISDFLGNYLFSSHGFAVWDNSNVLMTNGLGLQGSTSSTQPALIVPYPQKTDSYVVFTTNRLESSIGLYYSVVDMTKNNGKGDVVSLNNLIDNKASERLAAYKHSNGTDYWMVTKLKNTDEFYSYLLTSYGLDIEAVVSHSGNTQNSNRGQLKISPNGRFAACANTTTGNIELLKFDANTGIFSPIAILNGYTEVYGLEFSEESNYLYFSTIPFTAPSKIYQLSLAKATEGELKNSVIEIATISDSKQYNAGAMQLAPDGKIYIARYAQKWLAAIELPDSLGIKCQFNLNAIPLAGLSTLGLPSFPASFFKKTDFFVENACLHQVAEFKINTDENVISFDWNFGDVHSNSNTSHLPEPSHLYSKAGNYTVELLVHYECFTDTIRKQIEIRNAPIDVGKDVKLCGVDSWVLDAGNDYQTYIWTPTNRTTSILTVNLSGVYKVETTDLYGCTASDEITVNLYPDVDISATAQDETCAGLNNNSVHLQGRNGKPTYQYSKDKINYVADNLFTNVESGKKWYWVKDSNTCTDSIEISTQNAQKIELNSTITHLKCFGDTNGVIELNASGGSGIFSFSIQPQNFIEKNIFDNLTAGVYSFQASDSKGCISEIAEYQIIQPLAIDVKQSIIDAQCHHSSDASVQFTASGGSGSYLFNFHTQASNTTGSFADLASGIYTFAVFDTNNCSTNGSIEILQPSQFQLSANKKDVSCYNFADGWVELHTEGGTGVAQFSMNKTGYKPQTTFQQLAAGVYTFSAVDEHLCPSNEIVLHIENQPELILNFSPTNALCFGTATGSVELQASGGYAPYSFSMDNISYNNSFIFNNLNADIYTFYLKDKNLCTTYQEIEIGQPQAIVAEVIDNQMLKCSYSNNGKVQIAVYEGVAPYSIRWLTPNIQMGAIAQHLTKGIYTSEISDANNCMQILTVEVVAPNEISTQINHTPIVCFSDSTIVQTITEGGTKPYSYAWFEKGNSLQLGSNSEIKIPAGVFELKTIDSNSCTTSYSIEITQPTEIHLQSNLFPTLCREACNGSIQLDIYGGESPYNFDWSQSEYSVVFQNNTAQQLCAGRYKLQLTDKIGCRRAYEFELKHGEYLPELQITADSSRIYRGQSIQLRANSGYALYEWLPTEGLSATNVAEVNASPTETTTYTLAIEDNAGCRNKDEITLQILDVICDEPYIFVPNAFTPEQYEFGTEILYVRSKMISRFTFSIYNRWGEKVFETNNLDKGWDGTFNGKMAETAVYMYHLSATCHDGQQFSKKGNITLLR